MKSLRFKLTASFLLVTLIAFALIGVFANATLENQFKKYVIGNLNKKNEELVSALESRYTAWGGQWDLSGIDSIGMGALGDGLIVRVSGEDGAVLWDAMTHNSGMCAELLQSMAENMAGQHVGFDGGYTEKTYALSVGGQAVGSVAIGYYGPYFYTENDISFLNTLNTLLVLASVAAAAISFIFGSYMAKRLTGPISRVIRTTEEISRGNYDSRVSEISDTREIVELTQAVNTLADTLGKQEKLRKRLTADVAHELRTPVANLQSHLEAMIDGIWQADPSRLESCHDETVRLSKLVGGLETLARYDGEAVTLNKTPFDLLELMAKTAASFESEIQSKGIALTMEGENQSLEADRDKIAQVFINLLSNALKYTNQGGSVRIKLSGDDGLVRVSVRDSGIGIAPEDLPHIFERFYRADKSRSRATGGSGIGLSIAKSLVEAHGGGLTVSSLPGLGSEFVVTLPKNQTALR